jgi:hypothetical protein
MHRFKFCLVEMYDNCLSQKKKNLFALPLFEGICHNNSQNKSISLRAKLGVGLQNRTPTMSGARSWYERG